VKASGAFAEVPVGEAMLGRVINSAGSPPRWQGRNRTQRTRRLDRIDGPGIIQRKSCMSRCRQGNHVAIDAMIRDRPWAAGADHTAIRQRQGPPSPSTRSLNEGRRRCLRPTWRSVRIRASGGQVVDVRVSADRPLDYTVVVAAKRPRNLPLFHSGPLNHRRRRIAEYFQ